MKRRDIKILQALLGFLLWGITNRLDIWAGFASRIW